MKTLDINWPELPPPLDLDAPTAAEERQSAFAAEIGARVAYGQLPVWKRCITPKPVGWHVQGAWHQ